MAKSFLDLSGLKSVIAKLYGLMAPVYSESSKYALGALVIYKGILYKCTTAITVAEVWNADKWTVTTMAAENAAINSSLGSFKCIYSAKSTSSLNIINLGLLTKKPYLIVNVDGGSASTSSAGVSILANMWGDVWTLTTIVNDGYISISGSILSFKQTYGENALRIYEL